MPLTPTKPLLDRSAAGVWLEEIRRETKRDRVIESPDIAVNRGPSGTQLSLKKTYGGGGGGGAAVRQFRLKDWSYADFLVAREITANADWDPIDDTNRFTESETDTYIAKPFWLRQSEFDGLTITVETEFLSGAVLTTVEKFYKFTYSSATFRLVEQLSAVGGSTLASERQVVLPRFFEDEIIYAVECDHIQMLDALGNDVRLVAELPGRAWARAVSPFSA